jgi:hypothetical protein
LATAAGIAITFVVFIMGVPALIFQTFIAGSLRDVYNERLGRGWSQFVYRAAGADRGDCSCWATSGFDDWYVVRQPHMPGGLFPAVVTVWCCCSVLGLGLFSLIRNFQSFAEHRAVGWPKRLPTTPFYGISKNTNTVPQKDLEDLGILARELRSGRVKNDFLEQCERLVEFLLKAPREQRDLQPHRRCSCQMRCA